MMSILRAFSQKTSLVNLEELFLSKKYKRTEVKEYLKEANRILNTFKYQYVYDRTTKQLVHLTPSNDIKFDNLWNKNIAKKYIGEPFKRVKEFVEGKLDISTLLPRKPCNTDFDKIIRFLRYRPDPSVGRLNNLSLQPITYANFDLKSRSVEEFRNDEFMSVDSSKHKTPDMNLKRIKRNSDRNNGCDSSYSKRNLFSEQPTADKHSHDSFKPLKNKLK